MSVKSPITPPPTNVVTSSNFYGLCVTGLIQFERSGDRLNPPAEIVAVKWDEKQQKWQWKL